MRGLLLEEKNGFGQRGWQPELIEGHISDSAGRIERQKQLIGDLRCQGKDATAASDLLENLVISRGLDRRLVGVRSTGCVAWIFRPRS